MSRITGFYNYNTQAGDSFDSLALSLYNDEKMAHHIITFNPDFCDVLIFDANTPLRLPIVEDDKTPETLPPWRQSG